jgi:putative addiction module component (TIGR02574 family)
MSMTELLKELLKLSPRKRIELAEDLWDSVAANPQDLPPLTDEERAEIDRRLAKHERDPDAAVPWEDVRARLIAKFG